MVFFLGRIGHLVDLQIRCGLSTVEILSSDHGEMLLRGHERVVGYRLPLLQDGLIFEGVAYDSADTREYVAILVLMHLGDEDDPEREGNLSFARCIAMIDFLLWYLDEKALELPNALRRVEHQAGVLQYSFLRHS